MAKSRAKSEKRPSHDRSAARAADTIDEESPDLLTTLLRAIVVMLLVARWLVPTESAAEGETLWLSQMTLGAGLLWIWTEIRGRRQFRFGLIDASVAAIVLGHVLSGVYVFTVGGDKRAALNMIWEWVSLGLMFFLLRQILRGRRDVRQLMGVLFATTIVLSGLGIWQHYVFYPQATRDYDAQKSELNQLRRDVVSAAPNESRALQARIHEIESQFYAQGIPLEGPAQQLYEQRLRSSSEPFGMFALANSFAALLLPGLFVGLSLLAGLRARHSSGRAALAIVGLSTLLIAYCLLLTKSRTAWVGLIVGCTAWGLLALWSPSKATFPRRNVWIAAAVVVLCLLIVAAITSGALDAAVVTEALKSFEYRLQYWRGTASVLQDSPLFGTGPGNFRQSYLQYKLPESSEEIADPHNLLLDMWANAGLLGVAGLCGFLVLTITAVRRAIKNSTYSQEAGEHRRALQNVATTTGSPGSREILLGGAAAIPLILFADFFSGQGIDDRLVILWISWCLVTYLLARFIAADHNSRSKAPFEKETAYDFSSACLFFAFVAVTVHLAGAGGIEMPAIVQTLWVLAAGLFAWNVETKHSVVRKSQVGFLITATLIAVSFAATLYSAMMPVIKRNGLMAAGDEAVASGRGESAMRYFEEAAAADPFSPNPLERLAELVFVQWQQSTKPSEELFGDGVEFSRMAIKSDPRNPHGYWRLGEWFLQKYDRTKDPADAAQAVEELSLAVERYPHHALLRGLRADAYSKSSNREAARQEAIVALELHAINRREGHVDKCLPKNSELEKSGQTPASLAPTIEMMQELAKSPDGGS